MRHALIDSPLAQHAAPGCTPSRTATPEQAFAERDALLVSVLITGLIETRQLARSLRAVLMQPLTLPRHFRTEVLIANLGSRPAQQRTLQRLVAAAQRSAPADLQLRIVTVDVRRPLDALRAAARGAYIALLPANTVPQPDWLRAGLAALAHDDVAAAYGSDDHAPTRRQASSLFIRAAVLEAIAPGRFHATALRRNVTDWYGDAALRAAPRALTTRQRPVAQRIAVPSRSRQHPNRIIQLTRLATVAALGIAMTASLTTLHSQSRIQALHTEANGTLHAPLLPCVNAAAAVCSSTAAQGLRETRDTLRPTRSPLQEIQAMGSASGMAVAMGSGAIGVESLCTQAHRQPG